MDGVEGMGISRPFNCVSFEQARDIRRRVIHHTCQCLNEYSGCAGLPRTCFNCAKNNGKS
jgi:hypothetical protein